MAGSESEAARPEQELHDAAFLDMHLKVGEPLIAQPLAGDRKSVV